MQIIDKLFVDGKILSVKDKTIIDQAMKRANEMAQSQELSQSYFDVVLFSQVRAIQEFLHDIKEEQHQIAKKLTRL